MSKYFILSASLLALAACSTATVTSDRAEKDIKAACAVSAVKDKLPTVCADPARYAKDAATAAKVLQALKEAGK